MFESKIEIEEDGITHINCYSQSKCELGRALSNFALAPFDMEPFGRFCSIEGLWYWLGTDHVDKNNLRRLAGFNAKRLGRELKSVDYPQVVDFEKHIKNACLAKLEQNPRLKELLLNSSLPLTHYYVFNGFAKRDTRSDWIWKYYEEYRTIHQEN